ncbi:hypothetical protein E4U41_004133 [Claviceps citrina]|nr:hypothetical protein E4U41_004133 [Claviceps citrina]
MATTDESSAAQDTSFKDQLDREAVEQREREQPAKANPIVEKITQFIPAASKVLGPKGEPQKEERAIPGPPERPDHDPSIETFVRDQHRSKQPGGDFNSVAKE